MFLEEAASRIEPDDVLAALSNEHDRRILAITQQGPVEAQQILDGTGIAKSTLYRRLHSLEERGLIAVEEGVLRDGHIIDRFRATITSIEMRVREGRIQARFDLVDGSQDGAVTGWTTVDVAPSGFLASTNGHS